MRYKRPPWKTHYYTETWYANGGSTIWFESACRLTSAGAPSSRSTLNKDKAITCKRCLNALQKIKCNNLD